MSLSRTELLELLYAAYHSPFGVEVETNRPQSLMEKLYPVRAEHPELSCLTICSSPINPNEAIFIVRKPTDGPTEG